MLFHYVSLLFSLSRGGQKAGAFVCPVAPTQCFMLVLHASDAAFQVVRLSTAVFQGDMICMVDGRMGWIPECPAAGVASWPGPGSTRKPSQEVF